MRSTASLFPAVLAGFVAVLVGYASSAAIIWQAAAAAGASTVRRHRPVCPVDETDPALACRRYAGGRAVTVWPEGIQQS